MRNLLLGSLSIAVLAWSGHALAYDAQPVNPPAATGAPADTTAMAGDLKVGLSVKDSAGVTVGRLTELKRDAAGKRMATISMGADTVTVEADKLTAKEGAATVSLTQAELKSMAKKPRS